MIDCHIHSDFSPDSGQSIDQIIAAAKALSLNGVVITDHMDNDFESENGLAFTFDVAAYKLAMEKYRCTDDADFKVLFGIEEGFQPHVINKMHADITAIQPDMVINSIHNVNGLDPYYPHYYTGKTKKQAFTEYLEEIIKSMIMWDAFDVVGHIGYPLRYCPYDDKTMYYNEFKDQYETIFRLLIEKNKSLEINTSAIRTLGNTLPYIELLKEYKKAGGTMITIGSDAHSPNHIGYHFTEVMKQIKDYGFHYLVHFQRRNPVMTKIQY